MDPWTKLGIGMDMISVMVNFIKNQEPFTGTILIRVSSVNLRGKAKIYYFRIIILVAMHGGNSIRFWLHPVGSGSTPQGSFQKSSVLIRFVRPFSDWLR